MEQYQHLIATLTASTGVAFRPAQPGHLEELRKLGVPQGVVEFYEAFEPDSMTDGAVRLLPIEEMLIENIDAVPGYQVQPHGYIVFATSEYGAGYCFDTNQMSNGDPRIVLMSHETAEDIETAQQAAEAAVHVAADLAEFLSMVIDGSVPLSSDFDEVEFDEDEFDDDEL